MWVRFHSDWRITSINQIGGLMPSECLDNFSTVYLEGHWLSAAIKWLWSSIIRSVWAIILCSLDIRCRPLGGFTMEGSQPYKIHRAWIRLGILFFLFTLLGHVYVTCFPTKPKGDSIFQCLVQVPVLEEKLKEQFNFLWIHRKGFLTWNRKCRVFHGTYVFTDAIQTRP